MDSARDRESDRGRYEKREINTIGNGSVVPSADPPSGDIPHESTRRGHVGDVIL